MRPLNNCATCPACAVCEDDAFPIAASCEEMREIVSVVRRHFGEWISVKDKLPEKNGGVIVRVENGSIYSSVYAVKGGFRCAATHWMPLPEPPEGEST